MNVTKCRGGRQREGDESYDMVPDGYTGTVYTCSMHPEVRSAEEGKCPKCGMFLVPEGDVGQQWHHDHSGHAHAHGAATVGVKNGDYDTVPEGFNGTVYTCPMHAQVRHRPRILSDLRHGVGA